LRDKVAFHLFCLMFVQYAILTIGTRAIAQGSYFWLAVTDMAVSWLGFTILKKVEQADTLQQKFAYMIGGVIGAQVALFLTLRFIK
jgi:hypothetical protein